MVQRTSLLEQSELDEVELPKRRDKGGGEDGDDDMEGDDPMEVVRTQTTLFGQSNDSRTCLVHVFGTRWYRSRRESIASCSGTR